MLNSNKSTRSDIRGGSGFSIIEIIVALVVLSTAFFGLMRVFPLGMNMNDSSKKSTVASYLAQEKVEELFSEGYNQIATGTIESKHRLAEDPSHHLYDFQRKTEVTWVDGDLAPTSSDSGMKRIDTTVYYSEGITKSEQSFELNTIITKN